MTELLSHGSLALLVLALVVAGLGAPFPEDVVLLLAGALAHRGRLPLALVVLVCGSGVLAGDLLLFLSARRVGSAALERGWLARLLTEPRQRRIHDLFARHGARVVFVARHVAGLRAPVFATAGMTRMRLRTFELWDGLGICISVPVMVLLGYAFSDHIDRVRAGVARAEHWTLAVLGVAVALYALLSGGRRVWSMLRHGGSPPRTNTGHPMLLAWIGSTLIAVPAHADPSTSDPATQATAPGMPSCRFKAGALPKDTLPAGSPIGKAIPIDHFVVLVQENRSFDHYFQDLPSHGQPAARVAPSGVTNSARGSHHAVARTHLRSLCVGDPPHDVASVAVQYDGGKNDGFAASAGLNAANALGYYGHEDIPFYYELFKTFAIADNYFSSMLGPTWPNRMLMLSGTSFGHVDNTAPPARDEERSLLHQLEKAGLSWGLYADSKTFEADIYPALKRERGEHFSSIRSFMSAAREGKLPNFSWVESSYGDVDATDEHPPADIQLGQRWVWEIVEAVLNSPDWKRTALILTYDEHGGFYDHVPPPAACPPDDIPSVRTVGGKPVTWDRYGFRVPLAVVSPYAKRNYVSHVLHSHDSILRLVHARFNLPALSARDANALALLDMFDFQHPPFVHPPHFEVPPIDSKALRACQKKWPGRAGRVGE